MRKASIKETGEELSSADWARFDAAVARLKAERAAREPRQAELDLFGEQKRRVVPGQPFLPSREKVARSAG